MIKKLWNDAKDIVVDGILQDGIRAWKSVSPGTRKLIRGLVIIVGGFWLAVWLMSYSGVFF